MEFLKIAIASLGSIFFLFILTKLMGSREMSGLSMFDYINSITIGSIAGEMATSPDKDFFLALVSLSIYAFTSIILSFITSKSIKCRRILTGRSLILFDNGKIYNKNLKKSKIDLNEFLVQCRTNGFFNLADIETAILEPNGKISFLPSNSSKPVTPIDLNLDTAQNRPIYNLVIDGKILKDNLDATGNDLKWLKNTLEEQNFTDISQIFLATCDEQSNLSVYTKTDIKSVHDKFM